MNSKSISEYEQEHNEMKLVLRGIAHEMGNALTVMGYSIKSFGKSVDVDNNEHWSYINEDFQYICRLFKNLSAYNNSRDLKIEKVCLDKVLSSVVAWVKDEYENCGVNINYEGIKNAFIMGDEVKLRQVFINIIKNAYEAVDKGNIWVNIIDDADKYKVCINDDGCGIDEESINKIFEPMYTKKEGGTGLGLPVCKNIVESHGGRMIVKSQKNVGTEFILEFDKKTKKA